MNDVVATTAKLCNKYLVAEARITELRPMGLPRRRTQRRLEGQVMMVLGDLQDDRKPSGAALVRLAYVRALRASQPQARLNEEQEGEVKDLVTQLDYGLGHLESEALLAFRRHIRSLQTGQSLEKRHVAASVISMLTHRQGATFALEQRARTYIQNVVDMASTAGALAGTAAGEYDGGPHADTA